MKKKKRKCKKSKADLKDRKIKSAGLTKCFLSICPVPVVELYDSLIHDGQIYVYDCLLLYKVKAVSLNTCKITPVVCDKHPYFAPAFQPESSSVR